MDPSGGPIYSRFDDDPDHADGLDAFVLALAGRVDELQDTEVDGDLAGLGVRVVNLGREAEELGYPELAQVAAEVASAARERNIELAHKALVSLTNIARRVRQGHRGSL